MAITEHKTYRNSADYIAHVMAVLRSVDDAREAARRCRLSEMKARKWRAALLNGENLKQRILTHYHRYIRLPEAGDLYMRSAARRKVMLEWRDALLADLATDIPGYDLAGRYGVSEKLVRVWRDLLRDGEDLRNRLTTYHRHHVAGADSIPADKVMLRGEKCAMCGVHFEAAHGYAVVCDDCARRPDYRGYTHYQGQRVCLRRNAFPEVEI